MSFGGALLFCQMIVTPIIFGVLTAGWFNLIPQLNQLARSAISNFDSFVAVAELRGSMEQVGILLIISFVYALIVSIPLSMLFSSKS